MSTEKAYVAFLKRKLHDIHNMPFEVVILKCYVNNWSFILLD